MKKRPFVVILAVAAMLAASASCKCSRTQQQPRVETLAEQSNKLQNGLETDLISGSCSDQAALVVLLKAGIDHDPPGRSGMAHVAGRVLATSAGAGRAERLVDTGNDYTLYSVVVPAVRLPEEVDEVASWMSKFTPSEADLGRVRTSLLAELSKQQGDDAQQTAVALAEEALQPARGNGKRRGLASEVQAITLAELQAYWKETFKPGNARITVAGRFDAEAVRVRIETALGPVAAGEPPTQRPPPDSSVKGTLVMGNAPKAVAIAVAAPAANDPLFGPFLVLAARLAEKPAQPRTWDVAYDPIKRPETLLITGPVGPAEQPEPAAARMRAEAATILTRPLAPADLAAAKDRYKLLIEPRSVEPAICAKDARAFAVARARSAQLKVEGVSQAIDAATAEQLGEASRLFEPKRSAAVIAGGAFR
jgi:hypothetical protein